MSHVPILCTPCTNNGGPGVPGRTGLGSARFARAWGVGKGVGGGGGAGGPGPGQKFRSTLAKIAKILQENDIFLINTHYVFGERVCCRKNRRARRRPSTRGLELSLSLP